MSITLVQCKRTDSRYVDIRNRHYVANHGCIGQQIHYLIHRDKDVIGIISGSKCRMGGKIAGRVFRTYKREQNKRFAEYYKQRGVSP